MTTLAVQLSWICHLLWDNLNFVSPTLLNILSFCCLHLTDSLDLMWPQSLQDGEWAVSGVGTFSVRDTISPTVCEQEPQIFKKWGSLWWLKAETFALSCAAQAMRKHLIFRLYCKFKHLQNRPLCLIKHTEWFTSFLLYFLDSGM